MIGPQPARAQQYWHLSFRKMAPWRAGGNAIPRIGARSPPSSQGIKHAPNPRLDIPTRAPMARKEVCRKRPIYIEPGPFETTAYWFGPGGGQGKRRERNWAFASAACNPFPTPPLVPSSAVARPKKSATTPETSCASHAASQSAAPRLTPGTARDASPARQRNESRNGLRACP